MVRDGGETLGDLLAQIERFCDSGTSHDQLAAARARLAQALDNIRGMLSALMGYANASSDQPTEVHRVGLRSVPFLLSVADVHIGWLLLWHAEVALDAIDTGTVTQRATAPSTAETSRRQCFSLKRCCHAWPPTGLSSSLGLADGTRGRGVLRGATASLVASPVGAAR